MKKGAIVTVLLLVGCWLHRCFPKPPAPSVSARDFVGGLPALRSDMKLIVARLDFTQTSEAASTKTLWGVDLGTTKASLSVPARAQYAVDLSGDAVSLSFNRIDKTLTAVFPDPKVQSLELFFQGASSVVEPGWGRMSAFSGQAALDGLRSEMYDVAKTDAVNSTYQDQVKDLARKKLAYFLGSYAEDLGLKDVKVVVRFRSDEAPASELASRS